MARYRRRKLAEAWQVGTEPIPRWVGFYQRGEKPNTWAIDGFGLVEEGNFLVREDGNLSIMPPEVFHHFFESVEAEMCDRLL